MKIYIFPAPSPPVVRNIKAPRKRKTPGSGTSALPVPPHCQATNFAWNLHFFERDVNLWMVESPFDSKRYALLAQDKLRAEIEGRGSRAHQTVQGSEFMVHGRKSQVRSPMSEVTVRRWFDRAHHTLGTSAQGEARGERRGNRGEVRAGSLRGVRRGPWPGRPPPGSLPRLSGMEHPAGPFPGPSVRVR